MENNKKSNRTSSLGKLGELFAQGVYRHKGYKVIDANVFNKKGKRVGEVDFIAVGENDIAFVEVKTRSSINSRFGSGLESVNIFKQKKLLKMVKLFLLRNRFYTKFRPHIDIVSILWANVDKKPEKVIITSNAVEDLF